jgi:outer membrane protein OmpA-like peptidoglycan-associated protein
MNKFVSASFGFATIVLLASQPSSLAQTIGYAEALGALAKNCTRDIDTYCKGLNLSGGAVGECLDKNWSKVSPNCKTASATVRDLLKKRALARATVPKVCELDRLKFCGGIQPGDANLLQCFETAKQNVSAPCRQAIADAGYEAPLATGPVTNQIPLSSNDIVSSLQGVENAAAGVNAAMLRQMAIQGLRDPARANPVNRPPLYAKLDSLAQMTVAIQFDLGSARIRPSSYSALGLMADALYSPYLQGYCFLVVGHTDSRGSREFNLKLSDKRAEAIRAALINPFGIGPGRIEAVGLGEEQLLNSADPKAEENRRVQLINVGKLGNNAQCPNRPEKVIQ